MDALPSSPKRVIKLGGLDVVCNEREAIWTEPKLGDKPGAKLTDVEIVSEAIVHAKEAVQDCTTTAMDPPKAASSSITSFFKPAKTSKPSKVKSSTKVDIVEINVGGRLFTTRLSTLQFDPDSMLAKLFDPASPFGPVDTDKDGRPFLDRDADGFALVLDYLRRSGRTIAPDASSVLELQQL
jgi:hypothetical protein